jgi:hypothetical protein
MTYTGLENTSSVELVMLAESGNDALATELAERLHLVCTAVGEFDFPEDEVRTLKEKLAKYETDGDDDAATIEKANEALALRDAKLSAFAIEIAKYEEAAAEHCRAMNLQNMKIAKLEKAAAVSRDAPQMVW